MIEKYISELQKKLDNLIGDRDQQINPFLIEKKDIEEKNKVLEEEEEVQKKAIQDKCEQALGRELEEYEKRKKETNDGFKKIEDELDENLFNFKKNNDIVLEEYKNSIREKERKEKKIEQDYITKNLDYYSKKLEDRFADGRTEINKLRNDWIENRVEINNTIQTAEIQKSVIEGDNKKAEENYIQQKENIEEAFKNSNEKLEKELEENKKNIRAPYEAELLQINKRQENRSKNTKKRVDEIELQIKIIEDSEKIKIEKFLQKSNNDISSKLLNKNAYRVCEHDFSATELPKQLCIGYRKEKIGKEYTILQLLFKEDIREFKTPLNWDIKSTGCLFIDALGAQGDDFVLDQTICGLVMKYLEEFPAGKIRLHFVYLRETTMFFKIFINSFRKDENGKDRKEKSKAIVYKKVVGNSTEAADLCKDLRSLVDSIANELPASGDIYSFGEDKTKFFNLIVIRSGFQEVFRDNHNDFATFIGDVGRRSGVRMILVNDSIPNASVSDYFRRTIDELKKKSVVVEYDPEKKYFRDHNGELYLTKIEVDDKEAMEKIIFQRCSALASIIDEQASKYVLYEDIGFGDKGQCVDRMNIDNLEESNLLIPIGKGTTVFSLPFSCGNEGTVYGNIACFVMGKSGYGKSSVFDSIVLNGCWKYSPEDLEFWLLDCKDQSTLTSYLSSDNRLPHIRLISEKSTQTDGYSLLKKLQDEIARRISLQNQISSEHHQIFGNIAVYNDYVDKHSQCGPHLSRIIFMIDEVQKLFSRQDTETTLAINSLIDFIVTNGRSSGVHLVLISQSLTMEKTNLLTNTFLNNCNSRICFQMNEADSVKALGSSFSDVISDIGSLEKGVAYTTLDGGNSVVSATKTSIAYAPASERSKYFQAIRERYSQWLAIKKMLVLGSTSPIYLYSHATLSDCIFIDMLKKVSYNGVDGFETILGEDVYSFDIHKVQYTTENKSGLVIFGSDLRISASILAITLLQSFILKTKIYICDGDINKNSCFNKMREILQEREIQLDENIITYCDNITQMLTELYELYKDRKKQKERDNQIRFKPIMLFIHRMEKLGIEILQSSNVSIPSKISGPEGLFCRQTSNSTESTLSCLDLFKTLQKEGNAVSIYVNVSMSEIRGTADIFKNSGSLVLCNGSSVDYSSVFLGNDDFDRKIAVKSLLASIRPQSSDLVSNMVVFRNNRDFIEKVKPVIIEYNTETHEIESEVKEVINQVI